MQKKKKLGKETNTEGEYFFEVHVALIITSSFFFLFTESAASYCCLGCGESFIAHTSFHIHLRQSSMCAEANPQPFTCHKCNQQFTKLEYLQQHVWRHANSFQDKHCSHCGKSFMSNSLLWRHLRTRTGYKPYMCEHCGKSFSWNGTLQMHLRTHTGDKPYKCEHCGRSFRVRNTLKVQLGTHRGDRL